VIGMYFDVNWNQILLTTSRATVFILRNITTVQAMVVHERPLSPLNSYSINLLYAEEG